VECCGLKINIIRNPKMLRILQEGAVCMMCYIKMGKAEKVLHMKQLLIMKFMVSGYSEYEPKIWKVNVDWKVIHLIQGCRWPEQYLNIYI
jgi:hypothetical protein